MKLDQPQEHNLIKIQITLICSDAIKVLLSKDIPIEETILNCKDITRFICVRNVQGGAHKDGYYLGKVVRWYYSNNVVGTINYINNKIKYLILIMLRPCMELPNEFPTDIAYDYYLKKTIDILYDIGYYKKQEQMRLF